MRTYALRCGGQPMITNLSTIEDAFAMTAQFVADSFFEDLHRIERPSDTDLDYNLEPNSMCSVADITMSTLLES